MGAKLLLCGVEHLPPSSTDVMNQWSYISSSTVCHYGMDRDNSVSVYVHAQSETLIYMRLS